MVLKMSFAITTHSIRRLLHVKHQEILVKHSIQQDQLLISYRLRFRAGEQNDRLARLAALNNVCYSIQDNIIIACTIRIVELGDAPEHIGTITHCIKLQLPTARCTRSVHARLCKIAIDSDNCNTVCDQRIGDCIPRRYSRYRVVTLSSALCYLSITLFRELAEGTKTNVAAP